MFALRHLIDCFLKHTQTRVSSGETEPATLAWYTTTLKHLDPLGSMPADSLRTHHLAAIPFTNAFVRVLKRLYKWGAEEDLIPKDPFVKLTIPPCGRRERVLSRGELRRLYLACSRPFRRLLYVQLHTLARPGEIRQLTWGQINWDQRVIVLVKFKGKKRRKDQLKARAIPLSKPVLRLLKNLHRKSPDPSATGRVFYNTRWYQKRTGTGGGGGAGPWAANAVRCAMRVARAKAGLADGGERVVCYHLRHTGATEAVRAEISLKLVAEVMGHARTSTTERYTHLNTADMVATIDRMNARPRPKAG